DGVGAAVAPGAGGAPRGGGAVAGIGLPCLAPVLVLLDDRDRPLRPVWTPVDRRARQAARQVWAAAGADFLGTAGCRPRPGGGSAGGFPQQPHRGARLLPGVPSYPRAHRRASRGAGRESGRPTPPTPASAACTAP